MLQISNDFDALPDSIKNGVKLTLVTSGYCPQRAPSATNRFCVFALIFCFSATPGFIFVPMTISPNN